MLWSELKARIDAALEEAGLPDAEVGTIDVGIQTLDSVQITLEGREGDPLLAVF